jgi:hypothetical protein
MFLSESRADAIGLAAARRRVVQNHEIEAKYAITVGTTVRAYRRRKPPARNARVSRRFRAREKLEHFDVQRRKTRHRRQLSWLARPTSPTGASAVKLLLLESPATCSGRSVQSPVTPSASPPRKHLLSPIAPSGYTRRSTPTAARRALSAWHFSLLSPSVRQRPDGALPWKPSPGRDGHEQDISRLWRGHRRPEMGRAT